MSRGLVTGPLHRADQSGRRSLRRRQSSTSADAKSSLLSAKRPLSLTPSAIAQLNRIQRRESNPGLALRIGVSSGGCSGYQYVLGLADTSKDGDVDREEDQILAFDEPESGGPPPLIVVDKTSLSLIRGSTVDFATELIGSAFRIMDNPQSKNKGCGCGISWELRDDFEFD